MGDFSYKKSIVVYYPHIELLFLDIISKGISDEDTLLWIGYVISDMLCLEYDQWEESKRLDIHLNKVFEPYYEHIYLSTVHIVKMLNVKEIISLRYLGAGSVAVFLR